MHLEVETVPYAFIVLHAVKYPSKAIYGLLLGEKKHDKIKVTSFGLQHFLNDAHFEGY